MNLNPSELTYFLLTIIILTLIFVKIFRDKRDDIWSPLFVLAVIYGYYLVLGPYFSIIENNTYSRLVETRPYYVLAWKAGLISLMGILSGYFFGKAFPFKLVFNSLELNHKKRALQLITIGILGILIAFGISGLTGFNFLQGEQLENVAIGGGFRNYFLFAMNFFIPAAAILTIAWLNKKSSIWPLIFLSIYSIGLFTTLGFRYRIILIIISVIITYNMKLNKRPNWLLMGAFTYLIIAFMGYVGLTRSYGRGLSEVKPTQSLELSDFFLSGFSDAQVFQTTGLMIHGVPLYYSHTGFLPLLETIALPVPRAFWPEKPTGQSLEAIFNVYHAETGYRMAGMGAAELNYGEHYVAFGWMGVIVLGLITGLFFRIAWDSYKNSSGSEIAIIFIAVFNAFIYVVISRGYLPQVVLNFFFTVFPVLVIYWKHWKIVRM